MAISGGSTPPVPELPPEPPPAPTKADAGVQAAREDEKRRQRAAAGASGTILTGGQGVTDAATVQKKTLLGS